MQADLRGIHSHGVLRVPNYVAKLTGVGRARICNARHEGRAGLSRMPVPARTLQPAVVPKTA